jgi:sulfopyruvate decarboxylase subunit beta
MTQKEYISTLLENNKDSVIIGSIGTISYDLKDIEHPNKILVKGAMGSVIPIGFGYALANPSKNVVVLIGEGALMMKLGCITTVMKYNLPNLRIIVMNNGRFASCGTQRNNFDTIKKLIPFEIVDV